MFEVNSIQVSLPSPAARWLPSESKCSASSVKSDESAQPKALNASSAFGHGKGESSPSKWDHHQPFGVVWIPHEICEKMWFYVIFTFIEWFSHNTRIPSDSPLPWDPVAQQKAAASWALNSRKTWHAKARDLRPKTDIHGHIYIYMYIYVLYVYIYIYMYLILYIILYRNIVYYI